MKFVNSTILSMAFIFGLLLGGVDAFFDWMYHYDGKKMFLDYAFTQFPLHEVYWRCSFLVVALLFGLIISYYYNKKKDAQSILDNIFDSVIPICITNNDYDIIMANRSYYNIFSHRGNENTALKCYESRPGPSCQTDRCPIHRISRGDTELYTCETTKVENGSVHKTFIVTATPFRDATGRQTGVIECFQDITSRKELEREKVQLIDKLNNALGEVKKLSGFLPICATCKKIRDDKGYWNQVESYISQHSEAEFSHSICPQCASRYYAKLI